MNCKLFLKNKGKNEIIPRFKEILKSNRKQLSSKMIYEVILSTQNEELMCKFTFSRDNENNQEFIQIKMERPFCQKRNFRCPPQ